MVSLKISIILICFVKIIQSLEKSEFLQTGYEQQPYDVITEDDHVLRMFRMTKSKSNLTKIKTPVLLIHGLAGYSDNYLYFPDSLGYQLVDAGFDLFLGNTRGNVFTRHLKYNRSDNRYWDFGLEEQAKIDLPALIESVLNITNAEQIHLITYSLSFLEYIMMVNYRPDLRFKIKQLVGMGPTLTTQGGYIFVSAITLFDFVKMIATQKNNQMFSQSMFKSVILFICKATKIEEDFCAHILTFSMGDDVDQIDFDLFRFQFGNYQSSTKKQLLHLAQMILTNQIKAFDYGSKKNMKIYGSFEPPKFNLTSNIAPTCLFFGKSDTLQPVSERYNVEIEMGKSANVTIHSVPYRRFGHLSFIYAKNSGKILNPKIVKCILDRENLNTN